jgi:hypothetical protein
MKKMLYEECKIPALCQWLTPVILATQEAEVRRKPAQTNIYLEKTHHKNGLAEWLKQ